MSDDRSYNVFERDIYRLGMAGVLLLIDCCERNTRFTLSKRIKEAILNRRPVGIGGMSV